MKTLAAALLAGTCLLSVPPASDGQAQLGPAITGRVLDEITGEPLEFVNVFVANTTAGTSTGSDGRYTIRNVRPGSWQVVASLVGHVPVSLNVDVGPSGTVQCDFRLRPREIRGEEIEVYGREPVEWKRNLELFRKAFIGQTDNALRCMLKNPEVLNFRIDEQTGTFRATTESTLVIENLSLGYRIFAVLETFEWDMAQDIGQFTLYPRFEELTPATEQDRNFWVVNRQRTHDGSLKHFLEVLSSGRLHDEMFSVFSGPLDQLQMGKGRSVRPGEMQVSPDPITNTWTISFAGWLRVDYKKGRVSMPSFIALESPYVRFDSLGTLLTPLAVKVAGSWGKSRVADMLPSY